MTIREVSEKYGISQDTLRYYERIGMIPEVTRTSSGIRNYQPEDLGWVELAGISFDFIGIKYKNYFFLMIALVIAQNVH